MTAIATIPIITFLGVKKLLLAVLPLVGLLWLTLLVYVLSCDASISVATLLRTDKGILPEPPLAPPPYNCPLTKGGCVPSETTPLPPIETTVSPILKSRYAYSRQPVTPVPPIVLQYDCLYGAMNLYTVNFIGAVGMAKVFYGLYLQIYKIFRSAVGHFFFFSSTEVNLKHYCPIAGNVLQIGDEAETII